MSNSLPEKHRRAALAAHAEAEQFFKANPARVYHVQKSRPFEQENWVADEHEKFDLTIAFRDRVAGTINRFRCTSKGPVPDTDSFLFEIWSRYIEAPEGTIFDISAGDHAKFLFKGKSA